MRTKRMKRRMLKALDLRAQGHTYREIGKHLEVSGERARQIHKMAEREAAIGDICDICDRPIPAFQDIPLCNHCRSAAEAAGRQQNEADRYEREQRG